MEAAGSWARRAHRPECLGTRAARFTSARYGLR